MKSTRSTPFCVALPRLSLLSLAVAAVLAACGGGDDPAPTTGVFLDSAVEGLEVAAGSAARTRTNAQVEFSCMQGDTVSFSIGGVALGSTACAAVVTPLQLAGVGEAKDARVVNRLLALQLLDEDNDPSNGIRITEAVRTALAGSKLDFSAPAADFGAALGTVLGQAGTAYAARDVNADRRGLASEHFEDTLASRGTPVAESF